MTRLPNRTPTVLPAIGGLMALLFLGRVALAGWLALVGAVVVIAGVQWTHRSIVTLGGVVMLSGVAYGALAGLGNVLVLGATVASVVTWDTGTISISLDAQLGPAADTATVVSGHVLATTVVAGLAAVLVLLVEDVSTAAVDPVAPLALLLLAVLLFTGVLDRFG